MLDIPFCIPVHSFLLIGDYNSPRGRIEGYILIGALKAKSPMCLYKDGYRRQAARALRTDWQLEHDEHQNQKDVSSRLRCRLFVRMVIYLAERFISRDAIMVVGHGARRRHQFLSAHRRRRGSLSTHGAAHGAAGLAARCAAGCSAGFGRGPAARVGGCEARRVVAKRLGFVAPRSTEVAL